MDGKRKSMPKPRDFKLDFDNGQQIRQKKDAFKDFVKEYKKFEIGNFFSKKYKMKV